MALFTFVNQITSAIAIKARFEDALENDSGDNAMISPVKAVTTAVKKQIIDKPIITSAVFIRNLCWFRVF
jgi:hypothetical protein